MRIAVIHEDSPDGLGQSIIRSAMHLEHEVISVTWPPKLRTITASLSYRSKVASSAVLWNKRKEALSDIPMNDLTIVVKGALLTNQSVKELRRRSNGPLICWNPDDPFDQALSNSGAGIAEIIHEYDVYVTWSSSVAERIGSRAKRVVCVPFAWDSLGPKPRDEIRNSNLRGIESRPVLVGTWTRERESLIRSIQEFEPIVYGNDWPELERIDIRSEILGVDFASVMRYGWANVNPLRPQNSTSHNMRTYEILGYGGRQIAQVSPEHVALEKERPDIKTYSSYEDLHLILSGLGTRDFTLPIHETPTYVERLTDLLQEVGLSK